MKIVVSVGPAFLMAKLYVIWPNAVATTALNKKMRPISHENNPDNCTISLSKTAATTKMKTDPATSMYPVNKRGSNVGFNLLIKMKLKACANIDRKMNPTFDPRLLTGYMLV